MIIRNKNRFLRYCACAALCALPFYAHAKKVVKYDEDENDEDEDEDDSKSKVLSKSNNVSSNRMTNDSADLDSNNNLDTSTVKESYKLDIYDIKKTYILNSLRVWLEMHLEEAHNVSFFTDGCELTRHIINGVEAGLLQCYSDEECKNPMSKEDFLKNLRDPASLLDAGNDDNSAKLDNKNYDSVPDVADRFLSRDLSTIRLMVDFVVDSLRSLTHTRIMSICIVIPSKKFATGLEKIVGHFDYRELMSYFATISPDNSWIDPINSSNNKRFSDVFSKKHYWYPQSYLICTSEDRVKKNDPQKLDLKKIAIDDTDYLMYHD